MREHLDPDRGLCLPSACPDTAEPGRPAVVAMLTKAPPSTAAEGAVRDALAAVDRGIACLHAAKVGLQAALAFARGEPDPADQEAP